MEGSPVFGEHAPFVGILIRPLRQESSGAEIQLVIPWEAIATACSDLLLKEPQNGGKEIHINRENLNAVGNEDSHELDGPSHYKYKNHTSYIPSPLPVEKAMASSCLIIIDEGVWASGVLLNEQGLILTNAHLLEPWRFGKRTVNGGEKFFLPSEESAFPMYCESGSSLQLPSKTPMILASLAANNCQGYRSCFSNEGQRNIRVRLDHVNPWIWCNAKVVYVCKGTLDVALLQLECPRCHLCPIVVDFTCPSLGSKAYVIGHGLFGPRCAKGRTDC